jgi:paraquat-inducible protein A
MGPNENLTCHLCGQDHRPTRLAPGEKALCTRCGTLLAKGGRFGPEAALVFSVTGLILALPAALLPFVGAGKLGNERVSLVLTGVEALWGGGMKMVAVVVLLCGGLLPVTLLAVLALIHAPQRLGWQTDTTGRLRRCARILEHWAIPEVQVLAVLVALMKLGSVVEVTIGPGFWCYCAMALSLILAQQSFHFDVDTSAPPPSGRAATPS